MRRDSRPGSEGRRVEGIMKNKTYIIAEAGVNHNGSMELAKRMVEEAAAAGADCIKFQTFKPASLVSRYAQKAEYQKKTTGSGEGQLEMLSRLTLPGECFAELFQYAAQKKIDFASTAFDEESITLLDNLGISFWKIPSGEVTNYPYLVKIGKTGKPIVMSTGMCCLAEIRAAVDLLKDNGAGTICLLHCTTEYPAPYKDVNLRAMDTLRREFNVEVGYSDHTQGIEVPVAAVAMGATVIEKHFTLDRNMEGPDHKASLEAGELKQMVDAIRHIEKAIGTSEKIVTESERKNIAIARKSIVARKNIRAGELLTEDNITTKRPGNGINPMRWPEVLGRRAVRDFAEDELIEL